MGLTQFSATHLWNGKDSTSSLQSWLLGAEQRNSLRASGKAIWFPQASIYLPHCIPAEPLMKTESAQWKQWRLLYKCYCAGLDLQCPTRLRCRQGPHRVTARDGQLWPWFSLCHQRASSFLYFHSHLGLCAGDGAGSGASRHTQLLLSMMFNFFCFHTGLCLVPCRSPSRASECLF